MNYRDCQQQNLPIVVFVADKSEDASSESCFVRSSHGTPRRKPTANGLKVDCDTARCGSHRTVG
jgi:hypothetical protein